MIDADLISRNLCRFEAVFDKLTPNEKKDLLRLLVKEIIYNQDPSKIKMTLLPLPELDLEVEGDKVSFDECQKWLVNIWAQQDQSYWTILKSRQPHSKPS